MDEKTRKTKTKTKQKKRKKKKKKSLTLDPSWTKKFAGSFGDSITSYVSFRSASLLAHQTISSVFAKIIGSSDSYFTTFAGHGGWNLAQRCKIADQMKGN
jgi:hypothetical protein